MRFNCLQVYCVFECNNSYFFLICGHINLIEYNIFSEYNRTISNFFNNYLRIILIKLEQNEYWGPYTYKDAYYYIINMNLQF